MLPWVLAGVGTVISSLSGAVAFLYRGRIADLQARIKRQDEQIDRLLADVEPRLGRIEERQGRR